MNRMKPVALCASRASYLCVLAVTALLFLLVNTALASPESPTPTTSASRESSTEMPSPQGGKQTETDHKDADGIKARAEAGDANSQNRLGFRYYNGEGVAKDFSEAVKWYRKAAEQNDDLAQYNLGICYVNGEGVAKDAVEAVKWYRKAAEQDYAPAQMQTRRLLRQRRRRRQG